MRIRHFMQPIFHSAVSLGKLPGDLVDQLGQFVKLEIVDRTQPLPLERMQELAASFDVILSEPQDRLDRQTLEGGKVKMIAQRAVGYDNIDFEYCKEQGILVANTPGVLDKATADLAFSLFLACARRIVEADKYVRAGLWNGFENELMLGHETAGKTFGIVGMGRIGKEVARRAQAFDMRIIYTRSDCSDSFKSDEKDLELQKSYGACRVSLSTLMRESHFISLNCPLNKNTAGLIGAEQIALMKDQAILINTSRGKVVDEAALVKALVEKRIVAGLDVFSYEPNVPEALIKLNNVVLAPHIGSATEETRKAMAQLAVNAVIMAAQGKSAANLLNQSPVL